MGSRGGEVEDEEDVRRQGLAHAAGMLVQPPFYLNSHARPLQFFNNRDDADVTNGMSVPVFMDWLEELDPIISIDDTCERALAAAALAH